MTQVTALADTKLKITRDEVTQICPVPLPLWMADSAGKGILIVAVCHGLAQLQARWDTSGAHAIWDTAGIKVILGGVTDNNTLDGLSRLCGDIALRTRTQTTSEDGRRTYANTYQPVRVLPPELLRELPEWRALVIRGNLSPVIVRLRMAWRRRDYRRTRHARTTRQGQLSIHGAAPSGLTWRQPTMPATPAPPADHTVGQPGGSPDEPALPDAPATLETLPRPRPAADDRAPHDAPPLAPPTGSDRPRRAHRPWDPPASSGDRQ